MTDKKVDKTPVDGQGPDGEGFYPDSSRSLESLRQMRLMALLRDMIESEDGAKAAARLGVSYRTVSRAIESGRLTARMSAALERHLLLGGGSAAARLRESVGEMAERVGALEEEFRSRLKAVEDGSAAVGEEQARAMRALERRVARLEAGGGIEGASEKVPPAKPAVKPPWREYRDLVSEEAEPGEELVYGDAAPVIAEWRLARARSRETIRSGTTVDRLAAYERVLELELELIEGHDLTLPPSTYPWDRPDRRQNLRRRKESLKETRADRARAELLQRLLRLLTFGLWRR